MRIGVPTETFTGERRVALIPASVGRLVKDGHVVLVQKGAGFQANFSDAAFVEKGARLLATRKEVFAEADIVAQVHGPGANPAGFRDELALVRQGQMLLGFQDPLTALTEMRALAEKMASVFALELLPRITRAQPMDALSSMATITGYKAVLLAANRLPRLFPMMITAAGTVTAAKVLVLGAGVAGLQAIATAKRLGAVVSAYDVRSGVKEQVESLGGKFVELPIPTQTAEGAGGYAKAMDEEFYRRQQEVLAQVIAGSDVIVATAAVPGMKAPMLISASMVKGMATGSIIVDLAAERGGNCELTRPGEEIEVDGVTIIGPVNLASAIPNDASRLYSGNITSFLNHLAPKGQVKLNLQDPILKETLVTHEGSIVHPRVAERL